MKKELFVTSFFFLLTAALVHANEKKIYIFNANTLDASGATSNLLNGNYEVTILEGNCHVVQVLPDQFQTIAGNPADEICRMVGIDKAERAYFPPKEIGMLSTGKEWKKTHSYTIPGVRRPQNRTVFYKIISEEKNKDNEIVGFIIEGVARVVYPSGEYTQKWTFRYDPHLNIITNFFYDSAVGEKGAKINVEFVGLKKLISNRPGSKIPGL